MIRSALVMKELTRWIDQRYNITNIVYETENGVKLLHSLNPVTTDVFLSTVIRAGASFEPLLSVPEGTVHCIEHLLFKPGHIFKTQEDIDTFEYGSRTFPLLSVNASTGKKYVYVYGYSNENGFERLRKRLGSILLYPSSLFEEYLEKEKGIILSEMMQQPKPEKDRSLAYDKFILGKQLPHFTHRVIGSQESVSTMTVEQISGYHSRMFGDKQVIFSLQSRKPLEDAELAWFEDISKSLPSLDMRFEPPSEKIENIHDYDYFFDDHEEGVYLSMAYFRKISNKNNYPERVLFMIMGDLLNKLSFDILREKKSLVYGFDLFNSRSRAFTYETYGFSCDVEGHKVADALQGVYDLLYTDIPHFLNSPQALPWFESSISSFIFPHTSRYDSEYAEHRATELFEGREIYLFSDLVEAAKKIKLADLVHYLDREMLSVPPRVWMSGSRPDDETRRILEESAIHTRWKKEKRSNRKLSGGK